MTTKIKGFNSSTLDLVRDEMNAAFARIEDELGISLEIGTMRYDRAGQGFRCQVEGALVGENGEVLDKQARDFGDYAPTYGIPADALFQTFQHQGRTFKIVGWKPRATKRPIVCTSGTQSFSFPVSLVSRLLDVQSAA